MRRQLLAVALALLVAGCAVPSGAMAPTKPAKSGRAIAASPTAKPYPPLPDNLSFVVGYTPAEQAVSLSAAQTPILLVDLSDPGTTSLLGAVAREERQVAARYPGPPLMVVVQGGGSDVSQAVYRLRDLIVSAGLVLPAVVRAGAESQAPALAYECRGELKEIQGWPDAATLTEVRREVAKGENAAFGPNLGRPGHR